MSLIKGVIVLALFSNLAFAQTSLDPEKTIAPTPKEALNKAFNYTRVKGRIVKVSFEKQQSTQIKVLIVWHPRKLDDMLGDTLTIMETVNEIVPKFSLVILQAVNPEQIGSSKRIIWEALITKKDFVLLQERRQEKSIDLRPTPLFQE